jgi:hypothetical protein
MQWERNPAQILAWKEARTGYPFIDACMTQLRIEGTGLTYPYSLLRLLVIILVQVGFTIWHDMQWPAS